MSKSQSFVSSFQISLLRSIGLAMIGLFLSCNQEESVDFAKMEEEITFLHNQQRTVHFQKDSVAFVNQLSPKFISVNRGEISQPKFEETLSRYHNYFSNVEFLRWDDVQKPIIRFSDDGSLAYTIVDKVVEVYFNNEKGERVTGKTHFAWTSIYRKTEEGWKIECVTSTNKPIENGQ
nr:nuclear transport factor 2 family protein [Allomuricauda sp.]